MLVIMMRSAEYTMSVIDAMMSERFSTAARKKQRRDRQTMSVFIAGLENLSAVRRFACNVHSCRCMHLDYLSPTKPLSMMIFMMTMVLIQAIHGSLPHEPTSSLPVVSHKWISLSMISFLYYFATCHSSVVKVPLCYFAVQV